MKTWLLNSICSFCMYQWMLELHTVCPSWVLLGEIAAPKKTERKQKCCSSSSTNVWDLRIKAVVKAVANTSLGTQRSAAVVRWMGQCPRRVVSAVWHTVYTEHHWDHCRVVTTHHCSAAVSVTWSAVSRPVGGYGGGVLCSPLSSHDRCPAPATAALQLALGPNHNHNVVLSSDIFSKHKPAILNGNYAVD